MLKIRQFQPYLALICLLIIALATMIFFDRPLIRGDGVAYLAWLDTIALDLDIDLGNQVERLAPVNTYQVVWNDTTERWVIIFPFGTAFLHAPFYRIGHWFAENNWLTPNPDYFYQMQGVQLPYSLGIMFGTNLMMLAMLTIMWLLLRHMIGNYLSALMTYAFFVGTPLLYYATVEPLNSHSSGAFVLTIFYALFLHRTFFNEQDLTQNTDLTRYDTFYWIMLGIVGGLVILVRWQLMLAIAPVWLYYLYQRQWKIFAISAVAAVIALTPLFYVWNDMFGSPITIPFDEVSDSSFLNFFDNAWWEVLRANTLYSPLSILSGIGLLILAWQGRWLWFIFFFLIIAGQIFINGSALDWYAGNSFGMRRMSELYPIYGVLSAYTFKTLLNRYPYVFVRLSIVLLLIGSILFSYLYLISFLDYIWTNPAGWSGLLFPHEVIDYFLNQEYRFAILEEVLRTHVGPPAWTQPGP